MVTQTTTMPLPDGTPNPIITIDAESKRTFTGNCATTQVGVQRFERVGD